MADTEQDAGSQLPAVAGGGAGGSATYVAPLNPYVAGIAGLSIPRQVGVIVGLAASVALAVWLVLWTQGSDMRPLYGSLENLDAAAVVGVLESNGIRYRIDENSGALLVESARFHDARLLLAQLARHAPGQIALFEPQRGILIAADAMSNRAIDERL